MSSLAVGRGLELDDLEQWLVGLFTAAELAAADLLLQLSVAGGNDDEEAASTSTTPSSSPRWVSPCRDREDLAVDEKERVFEEPALPLGSLELDRRARKRYRLLSDLYTATSLVKAATTTRRRRRQDRLT